MKSSELREKFLKYFEKNGHKRLASSSLVPANDPTLFFTNAGMVQFKDVFLGSDKRPYKRATTSQKCMRVSGKHNDLEQVGMTPRHHTFFEMLGNFSFGDYFKKEAIAFGWEFLTKTVKIPKARLYVTIFDDDDEAEKFWKKHVTKDRIFRMGEKDNFWAMGDTGPCGPCSEIHYDKKPGAKVTKKDFESDRFVEIWNLVFMQFERDKTGKKKKLAKPSIDTGMGLERLAAIIQGVDGNYETDLFMPIISKVEQICGKKYNGSYDSRFTIHDSRDGFSMRVIADHIRAATFLVGDGVLPSNEGRGYVLRRIIRRAIRHGKMLGINKPFFAPIAHVVIDEMGSAYPELIQHRAFIEKVLINEEERFFKTLDNGLELLHQELKKGGKIIPGDVVFKLYDTYGFPKDLTSDIAAEHGMKIDEKGFEKAMNVQKETARAAWKGSGEESVSGVYKQLQTKKIKTKFVGYEQETVSAKVLVILSTGRQVDRSTGHQLQTCRPADLKTCRPEDGTFEFITDTTPFYGESGGQVGDTGIAVADGVEIEIFNTKKPLPDIIVHHAKLKKGTLKVGQDVTLAINSEKRAATKRNHTATHLLHKALRSTLGEHVKQAGSLVNPDRLRFDFSHFQALTNDEIKTIESQTNEAIRKNLDVNVSELSYDDAVSRGALAFFGEKYGSRVRLVEAVGYSAELCGGTHVSRTGDIGMVKIVGESSIAAGVRRIEAVTGTGVEKFIADLEAKQRDISGELKVAPSEIIPRIRKLVERTKKLEQQAAKGASVSKDDVRSGIKDVNGVRVIAKKVDVLDHSALRNIADQYKQIIGSGVVVVGSEINGKVALIVIVSKDLTDKHNAGNLVKKISAAVGGTGGGRPDMAQGGGPDLDKLDESLKLVEELI